MRESLRARLTIVLVIVVTGIVATFATTVCYAFRRSLVVELDRTLAARAATVARALQPAGDGTFDLTLPDEALEYFRDDRADRAYYAIWSAERRPIDVSDAGLATAMPGAPTSRTVAGRREIVVAGPAGTTIVVGSEMTAVGDAVRSLALVAAAAGVGAALVSVICGWLVAGRALAPIARISRTARAMADGDLSARIPIDQTESELGQVAVALNLAFDRLRQAIDQVRQFTADASHDLRTPLTTLTTETEWALAQDRSAEAYRESLATAQTAALRIGRVVEGLLSLARTDMDRAPLEQCPVRLDQVAQDVVALARPMADSRSLTIRTDWVAAEVMGDVARLQEAIANLVLNAVRYNRPDGWIEISVSTSESEVALRVRDGGIGVAAEHLPHLFDRFYRVDRSRRSSEGAGLGLAICKGIVEQHRGTVSCSSTPGLGSEFVVRLPRHVVARE
jgi:two-component system OmpR family sensor kinase